MSTCLNAHSQVEEVDLLNDRGFLVGDGVFETLRVDQGKLFWLSDHLERLQRHANKIKMPLPWSEDTVRKFLVSQIPDKGLYRLRLTVTAGEGGRGYVRPEVIEPRIFASFFTATPLYSINQLNICSEPVAEHMSSKTLSCMDRILHAPPLNQEWVMTREEGYITEATMSNLFWVRKGQLETPHLNDALLAGLTRNRILNMIKDMGITCIEDDFKKECLFEASEIFLSGTVVGIVRVEKLEEKILEDKTVFNQLSSAYQKLIDIELTQ